MQQNVTLKKSVGLYRRISKILLTCLAFLVVAGAVNAQTTIATTYPGNNAFGMVTFNFTNNNAGPVQITGLSAGVNLASGDASSSLFFKPSAINGLPGAISAANGWNQTGTTQTVTSTGTGTAQPVLTGLTLQIPAGATYGFAISIKDAIGDPALLYSNTTTPATFSGGGGVLTSGANVGYGGDNAPAAPTFTPRGFVGSITFAIVPQAPCTGTPAPGNTISSVASVCPSTPFNLSLQNATAGAGVTYQWQSSSTLTGTYTNIVGATNSTLTVANLTANTYYKAVVTCGANSGTSTAVLVSLKPVNECYCIPPSSNCTDNDMITNVTVSTLNNSSTCSPNGYVYYNALPAPNLVIGAANPITVTTPGIWSKGIGIWIDYNQNGIFEVSEYTNGGNSTAAPAALSSNIVIPSSALTGITRMRVRLRFGNTQFPATSPCVNPSSFGETEDYNVNLVPCTPLAITTQPASQSVVCGRPATFTAATTGSLPQYEWQYRPAGGANWLLIPAGAPYSGINTNTLTVDPSTAMLSGTQYRIIYTGACSGPEFSNAATLTVTPIVPTVSPTSATICLGSVQQLTLTNPSSPSTVPFASASNINIPIPDANAAGINHKINVSGIPAGAIISRIDVRLNITHPWVSDLEVVLKAANGQVLNLSDLVSASNQSGANFINTVFSSAGVNAISTGTRPGYTGTFKADAIPGPTGGFGVPAGPTGFLPTTTNWAALYNTGALNGDWTIAMYDAGPPDAGTLNNWTITITYGAPTAGTWTGPAGTIFTDAAATIPYVAGSTANSVYVKPTVTSNYGVSFTTTAPCTSAVTTIPVTVSTPATAVSAVANKAICVGTNTTFSSVVTGGANTVRQWQVSTDGGATYTNLANAGVYSGVTTTTLTITGATTMMNNYLYRLSVSAAPCATTTTLNSAAGRLTVNPTPVIVVSANPVKKLFPGLTTTLTAAVSPNAAATYAWYRNGVLVPGASARTLVVNINQLGSYYARVTDVNTCSGQSNTVVISDSSNDRLFIYPNPNNGMFQIRYYRDPNTNTADNFDRVVNIFDSKGARIYSKRMAIVGPYTMMNVDLSNLGKGVYHVDVVTSSGERLKTGSVLVQY